jgi:hypothetical protein
VIAWSDGEVADDVVVALLGVARAPVSFGTDEAPAELEQSGQPSPGGE